MSETEHVKGIMVLAQSGDVEGFCKKYVESLGIVFDDECYESYEEFVLLECRETHFIRNDNVYLIYSKEKVDPYDNITNAKQNEDGVIDFELRWYNGGASMEECLEEALEGIGL